ncbi:MAG: DUF3847 domain-containing protein [Lachnospiraceae bacterium]|nr:DUF3847 domain-containing protein [Lachnospiraceae bacterium]
MGRTKEELQEEIQKKKHEEEQLKHREQRAKNRAEYLTDKKRRDRTHRLITRGAALESIIPEAKDMSERPFYLAVENFFSDEDRRQKFCEELTRQTQTAEITNRGITERASSTKKAGE